MEKDRQPVPGRVSIGIPTLNRSPLALRSIQSALSQTYSEIEVIVSDDVSTDETVERVRALDDPRLVLIEQKTRLGLVANFDFCLHHATGEFFLLLGDDDVLLPEAIEHLVRPYLAPDGASVGVTWCPCRIADSDNTPFWITEAGPAQESPAELIAALFAGHRGPRLSSILVRTQDAIAAGGYEARYGDLCDIGNWGKAALLRQKSICIPQPLVQYTNHHGSTTSKSPVAKWQNWAQLVHRDLVAHAAAHASPREVRLLQRSWRNFLSGITLTILIQTIGKPGWVRNALWQAIRKPQAIFTPYMLRRLLKDGRKVLLLRRNTRRRQASAAQHTT